MLSLDDWREWLITAVTLIPLVLIIVMLSLRSSGPFREALARARGDRRVVEALGDPVKAGWFPSGMIRTVSMSGNCDLNVPLRGSKQQGSVHVIGTQEGGRWDYTRMIFTPKSGPRIDLLAQ